MQCNDQDAKAYPKKEGLCPVCKPIKLLTEYNIKGTAMVEGDAFRSEDGIIHVSGTFHFTDIQTCKR